MGLSEINFLTKLTLYGRNMKNYKKKMLFSVNNGLEILTKKVGKNRFISFFFLFVR